MKAPLLIFFFFSTALCLAQPAFPPVYEVKTDTPVNKIPGDYWQMLVDTGGKWTINDISSMPVAAAFHSNNSFRTGVGYSGLSHYWQRLKLKNSTADSLKLVFKNQPVADRFELFILRSDGKIEKSLSGIFVPLKKRDGFKERYAIPVNIAPGEEVTIYKKLFIKKADPFRELNIGFVNYDTFLDEAYFSEPWYEGDVREWFIGGILIFGFIFNFFFYYIVREKVYLYLALLLLVEGLWYLTSNDTVTFRDTPGFKFYFDFLISHTLFFFLVAQFVRTFLKTRELTPQWDKILQVLILSMVVSAVLLGFIRNLVSYEFRWIRFATNIIFFLLMGSLLLSFLVIKKLNARTTRLALLAAIPIFLMWSLVYFVNNVYSFLRDYFNVQAPSFIGWINEKETVIEMYLIAWFAILFTWILLQRYALLRKQLTQQELDREKERTELMNQQKAVLETQVEERTAELKKTIEDLKTTQKQLIQSEKMASLGELTAGIAHEIQNPLNFVNNFSEVNTELIAELKLEIESGNFENVKMVANHIDENEQKIVFHGKRADAIVKGMLQHSRSSSGVKEPTDINALADEYLRLAYHGLRAKDKSFNATIKTDFDETVGNISVIPQDMGRVILNLITNAFYAVTEKKKRMPEGYEPTVTVITKRAGGNVEISVRDNGIGIPQKVIEKIFQPFFTTKPTGEGTGLGLSLSYDIIKAHAGELKVKTEEGNGSEFIILLPVD